MQLLGHKAREKNEEGSHLFIKCTGRKHTKEPTSSSLADDKGHEDPFPTSKAQKVEIMLKKQLTLLTLLLILPDLCLSEIVRASLTTFVNSLVEAKKATGSEDLDRLFTILKPVRDEQNLTDEEYGVVVHTLTSDMNDYFAALVSESKMTSEEVYTPKTLSQYDFRVWDFNSPFHWRISRADITKLYNEGILESRSNRHAEVAVGTCLFLLDIANHQSKESRFPGEIGLFDLSDHSLAQCNTRLGSRPHGVTISTFKVDITKTLPNEVAANAYYHDSVAANFLLHCLHGRSMKDKRPAIETIASLLKPSGIFIGSTILGQAMLDDEARAGAPAMATLEAYNDRGIFGNLGDNFEDLATILNDLFEEVDIRMIGYCAVWKARRPKRDQYLKTQPEL